MNHSYTADTSGAFVEICNIAPTNLGALNNLTFAVKDVIDLKNLKTSFGNPLWRNTHLPADANATSVDQLLEAGARCIGKTVLSEFARGLTGVNHFFGMPINPKAPHLVPGGSSSGSASAVASGSVDFALGTDTGGSVRLPASYCGLYGMRPSTGTISLSGVNHLSHSFDTVGVFSRTQQILNKVMQVLLRKTIPAHIEINSIYLLDDLFKHTNDKIRMALQKPLDILNNNNFYKVISITNNEIDPESNDLQNGWPNTFKIIVAAEMWATLRSWISQVNLEYGKTTFVDFNSIQNINKDQYDFALLQMEKQYYYLNRLLSSKNLLCIPTVTETTPNRDACVSGVQQSNYTALRPALSISCLGRLPQITLPLAEIDGIPIGLSLLAAHGQDTFLLKAAEQLFNKAEIQF